ncbi:MAG: Peroxiredoxin [Actinomycetia bacterium]|nr:Peroxiredoxin [Actinomycetes bacterium]
MNAELASDFRLPSGPDSTLALSELRGRPVVLVFYPADWSPVCSDQLSLYETIRSEFDTYGAQLVGISVDGVWCHKAFAENRGLSFPLLSDFEPKGAVSRQYDVYREHDGCSGRALFLIDPTGVIEWREVVELDENPGADGILRALEGTTASSGR